MSASTSADARGDLLKTLPNCDEPNQPTDLETSAIDDTDVRAPHSAGQLSWRVAGALGGGALGSWLDPHPAGQAAYTIDGGVALTESSSFGVYVGSRLAIVATNHYHLYFNDMSTTIGTIGTALKFTGGRSSTCLEVGPALAAISSRTGNSVVGFSLGFDLMIAPRNRFGVTIMGDWEFFQQNGAYMGILHLGVGFGAGS